MRLVPLVWCVRRSRDRLHLAAGSQGRQVTGADMLRNPRDTEGNAPWPLYLPSVRMGPVWEANQASCSTFMLIPALVPDHRGLTWPRFSAWPDLVTIVTQTGHHRSPRSSPLELAGTHSPASLAAGPNLGTRANACLPGSAVQCAAILLGEMSPRWARAVKAAWRCFQASCPR